MRDIFTSPLEEKGLSLSCADPSILIIFGATGDLTSRRLFPALFHLAIEGLLSPNFALVGVARRKKSPGEFRQEAKKSIEAHAHPKIFDPALWESFQEKIFYHTAPFEEEEGYDRLFRFLQEIDEKIKTKGNRLFYLSTPPKYFPIIVEKLFHHKLLTSSESSWSRVIIEKPFGRDLASAQALQSSLLQFLKEGQIYRIDHWLGKETVQNLLVFRFANSIFESLWNNKYIDSVEITVAESLGVGNRGAFFEEQGILRDLVQNHMMQLLSLIAMEAPISLFPHAVHEEKIKVLQAIPPFSFVKGNKALRGQYGPGYINGEKVLGYRQEPNVDKNSMTETFAAVKLFVHNWRWEGVPFYLRAGKRLPKRSTEISIIFKEPPGFLFQQNGLKNEANILTIRIQPDEGISMKINSKVPGKVGTILPVKMDFRYNAYFGQASPEAYERLIYDAMVGDTTLFAREDEVFHSWRIFTPLLKEWEGEKEDNFPNYEAGSFGPKALEEWMQQEKRKWRLL